MQDLSSVAFSLAGTVSTLMSGSGGQVSLIDEFGQFWTQEERREIRIQKIFDSLMSQTNKINTTGKEVDHASGS